MDTDNAKFIVFEGIDGAGKTTQIKLLQMALTERGIASSISAEPTASTLGIEIRKILSGEVKKSTLEMAELFALDRISHNSDPVYGIEKLLSEGVTVISDRYYYSSMAYQGAELGLDCVIELNRPERGIRRPDLCIFLDLTPEQSLERINSVRDQKEIFENAEMLERTRSTFFEVLEAMEARGDRIVKIDASREISEVAKDILDAVLGIFSEN